MQDWPASEKETIQKELSRYLGPELVCTYEDAHNKLYYLPIQRARVLADEVFGHQNWNVEIKSQELEYLGEQASTEQPADGFVAAATCCVRITLRSGAFREDVGFAQASGPSKNEAIRKARAISKSDATKRALRLFGDTLGNCLYDHEFTSHLSTLTAADPSY